MTVIRDATAARTAVRQYELGQAELARSAGRLSTGLRVRQAADDAAALQIATGMRSQLRGWNQAVQHLQDGISLLDVADGALNEALAIVQRMREVSVHALNSIISAEQRRAIGVELLQLRRALDTILDNTQFNGHYLFRGLGVVGSGGGSTGTVEQSGGSLTVGTVLVPPEDGPGVSVAAINVTGADPGKTYTFSASGTNVTLTSSTGESQTVKVEKMKDADDTPQALNFNLLGIVITLEGYEGAPNVQGTGPAIAAALNGHTIVTALAGAGGGGASGTSTFVINPGAHGLITIAISRTQSSTLGSGEGFFLSQLIADESAVDTVAKSQELIVSLDVAIQQLSDERARIGAQTNLVESYLDYVLAQREELQASVSRIADADMAEQITVHVRTATAQDLRAAVAREAARLGEAAVSLIRASSLSER